MGIDKIKKKKKKKPNQLVSKRKDGKRPGYYGSDDYGSGEDGQGGGGGGGGGGGNGDNNDYYNEVSYSPAPASAPSYSVQDDLTDYATNVGSTASVGGGFDDDSNDDPTELSVQDYIEDYATNVGKTANLGGGFEDDDTGESLYITKKPTVPYVSPTLTMKEKEPYIGYTPGPNTVTADELSNLNKGIGDNDELNATLSKIQAINPVQKAGFFDSGIGSVFKDVGKIVAPFVAAPIAGLAFGKTAYDLTNLGMKANNLSNFANRLGLTNTTLTELINTPQGTGPKGPPTGFDDNDSGSDGNTLVANNVIAKNVQRYSPAQINNVKSTIDLFEDVISKGEYQGRQLNRSQIAQVASKRSELMQEYDMIMESLV